MGGGYSYLQVISRKEISSRIEENDALVIKRGCVLSDGRAMHTTGNIPEGRRGRSRNSSGASTTGGCLPIPGTSPSQSLGVEKKFPGS